MNCLYSDRLFRVISGALLTMCSASATRAAEPAGTAFTYQGELAQNGAAVDGDADFQFSLWDAAVGGVQIGVTQSIGNQPVAAGHFTVQLDFGNQFDGDARFLEIAVRSPAGAGAYTTLSPRQGLTPAPYALFALNAAGASDYWTQTGDNLTNSAGTFVGVNRDTRVTASEYFGVQAPVQSGYGGMYIRTDGADGWPFYGYRAGTRSAWHYLNGTTGRWHLYNSGNRLTVDDAGNVGIGTTDPQYRLDVRVTSPRAIFGWTTNAAGSTYGVYGQSDSTAGTGVFGTATAASGDTSGVTGFATSSTGRGVWGFALDGSGQNYGVYGETNSDNGYGGYFLNDGAGRGVQGQTISGVGVFGMASGNFGYGVRGESVGSSGVAVMGLRPSVTGTDPAVRGQTLSRSSGAVGVHGLAQGTDSQAVTYGVVGQSSSPVGVGVRGQSQIGVEGVGQQYGVNATASNIGGHAVHGEGTFGVVGRGNNGGAGVRGEAANGSTFGVYAVGFGGPGNQPALRADGGGGPAIYALGGRAIEGEGTEFGVKGTGIDDGYGGVFSTLGDGAALAVDGTMIIGASPLPDVPAGTRLAVDGKIMCEELEVQLSDDWPDYVFDETYQLMPLDQLERRIREDKHLPDVPSAEEIGAEGLALGQMQVRMLRKVEELTLYVIDLNHQLEAVRTQNEQLRARLSLLEGDAQEVRE